MVDFFIDYMSLFMLGTVAVLLFSGFPLAFVLGGVGVAYALIGVYFDVFFMVQLSAIIPRMFGGIGENLVLVAVPMFIFMGTLLERSGVAHDLLKTCELLTRKIPGGLAVAVTLLGVVMAASTGIVGASVIMLSLIALPPMLKSGYAPHLGLGTIAASGTLGILIPPSIMLVVLGNQLSVSVGTLFSAALVPGLMLASLYLLYIVFYSFFKPDEVPAVGKGNAPVDGQDLLMQTLRSFFPPVVLIFLVLGSIFFGWATPTEASGVGAAGAMLLAALKRRLNLPMLREVFTDCASTNAMVFFIFIGATVFSYVFRVLGGDDVVIEVLEASGIDTAWEVMLFLMGLVFLMGFFLDWIEISLIALPIFVPVLQGLDFSAHGVPDMISFLPWFAVLLAVNMQTSFLTPPFGFTLFFLKGSVPDSISMKQIYTGVIPFVLIQLLALLLILAFPQLVLWLPGRSGFLE